MENHRKTVKKYKSNYLLNQKIVTNEHRQTRRVKGGADTEIPIENIIQFIRENPKLIDTLKMTQPQLSLYSNENIIKYLEKNPDMVKLVQPMIEGQLSDIQKQTLKGLTTPLEQIGQSLLGQPVLNIQPNNTNNNANNTNNNANVLSLTTEEKPQKKEITELLKIVFRESWFQDQFLDILSKNIKTQYFNKILEVTLFNIFNSVLENINKNDNIIIVISLLKNNQKYFEELLKQTIVDSEDFKDKEQIYPSDDNVFRITLKTSTDFSRLITKNFRELLLPDTKNTIKENTVSDEKAIEFENVRAKYLLDMEKEKAALAEEEKQYKAKKAKDREESYNKMISQNIQAKMVGNIGQENIDQLMNFFKNIEGSTNGNSDESAVVITGEYYNEMIIRTVCDSIKEMLEKSDSTKEIVRIILNRFDYMLKEFIDIMQNNGILKMILLRIIDNHAFIFSSVQIGIEAALNKKIEAVKKTQAVGETSITKEDIQNDYAFFKSMISCVIDELSKNLQLYIPSKENPEDPGSKLTAGGEAVIEQIKRVKKQRAIKSKTMKKPKKGWFW